MILLLLACAILASLALGVLLAYGLCQAMFQVFRVHSQNAARARVEAKALQTLQGGA